jgi:high-affinity nickel-transport protein
MHEGDTPRTAGLYFALGHSTVVVVATVLLCAAAIELGGREAPLQALGALVGTSVSAAFLLLIAGANLVILAGLWRTFRSVRRGGVVADADVTLSGHGLLSRLLRPVFRMVRSTWHMYPLGLLFGLGFDTATEIGLLSISATEAARGVSLGHVLVFPALFASAMALVDTADSALMVSAYRWALTDPLRKLWYNLTITAASVVLAVFVGGIEALGLLSDRFGLAGGPWALVANLNENVSDFGFVVIGLFAVAWVASMVIYRARFENRLSVARR